MGPRPSFATHVLPVGPSIVHTETEVFHVVSGMCWGSSDSKPQGGVLDIGSSQISNKKISSPTHNLSNTPRDRDKKHPWVRRVPCPCCTCLETKVNFRCNWPRKKRHEDRFEVFLVPCLGQKWCWCVSVCWDEWGDLVVNRESGSKGNIYTHRIHVWYIIYLQLP